MQKYADYVTSQATWLGRLPTHWDCKKIGALFSERKVKVSDKDYAPLSVAKIGVVPQLETAVKTDAGDNRKLVRARDFVINSRSDRKGSCGVSELDGSVSLINIVLQPRKKMNNRYVHFLMRSQPFSEEYYRNGRGIVSDLWTTRYSEMKSILLPIPPREEQDQIVRFLDWKVSSINRLIGVKQKQIAALKEFMQAEIEKQLYAYPVEETVRLKQLGTFFKGGGFSRENLVEEEGCPAILYGDIYTQYEYKTAVINHSIDGAAYSASRKISKGDIVMAGTGETKDEIGKSILYTGDEIVAVGGDVIVFHPNEGINVEYLLYQLYSQAALKHRYINGKGDIIVHIYPTALGSTIIAFPGVEEQKKAVARINEIINQVKKAIAVLADEISVLREYRVRLIADTVTGEIDVRDIEIPEYEYVEETIDDNNEDCEEETEEQED
jgi:type I restriction enzyme S subunit